MAQVILPIMQNRALLAAEESICNVYECSTGTNVKTIFIFDLPLDGTVTVECSPNGADWCTYGKGDGSDMVITGVTKYSAQFWGSNIFLRAVYDADDVTVLPRVYLR